MQTCIHTYVRIYIYIYYFSFIVLYLFLVQQLLSWQLPLLLSYQARHTADIHVYIYIYIYIYIYTMCVNRSVKPLVLTINIRMRPSTLKIYRFTRIYDAPLIHCLRHLGILIIHLILRIVCE